MNVQDCENLTKTTGDLRGLLLFYASSAKIQIPGAFMISTVTDQKLTQDVPSVDLMSQLICLVTGMVVGNTWLEKTLFFGRGLL